MTTTPIVEEVATTPPLTLEQVGEELVALVEVVTDFVAKGTIQVTPTFAANVAKLSAACTRASSAAPLGAPTH